MGSELRRFSLRKPISVLGGEDWSGLRLDSPIVEADSPVDTAGIYWYIRSKIISPIPSEMIFLPSCNMKKNIVLRLHSITFISTPFAFYFTPLSLNFSNRADQVELGRIANCKKLSGSMVFGVRQRKGCPLSRLLKFSSHVSSHSYILICICVLIFLILIHACMNHACKNTMRTYMCASLCGRIGSL